MNDNIMDKPSIREEIFIALEKQYPDFSDYLKNLVVLHENRKLLDSKDREIAIIASLITQGSPEKQMKIHFDKAVKSGLSIREISELIMQVSLYSGMPSAVNAFLWLKEFVSE